MMMLRVLLVGLIVALQTYPAASLIVGYSRAPGTVETGTWGGTISSSGIINTSVGLHAGMSFTSPSSAVSVRRIDVDVASVATSGNYTARIFTNNSGSPGTQVGSNSGSQNISGAGTVQFTFGTPPTITGSTVYWVVIVAASGSNDISLVTVSSVAGYGSGRNSTITSITDSFATVDWRFKIICGL